MTLLPPIKHCPDCGAEVRWVRTKSGRFMPLDAWPSAQGRVALIGSHVLVAEVLRSNRAVEARARGLELFSAHAQTPAQTEPQTERTMVVPRLCPSCALVFTESVEPPRGSAHWGSCPRCKVLHPERKTPR